MRELPLYPEVPVSAVEAEAGLARDTACTRCSLSGRKLTDNDRKHIRTPRNVCIGDDGRRGGVLFVGEAPTKADDDRGRPLVGDSGEYLRKLVADIYKGPVAYSYAVRCHPTIDKLNEDHVDACRGYLATTIADIEPERIIALGSWSAYAILGRSVSSVGHRGGYAYLMNRYARPIPVFYLIPPVQALRNRFLREWFKEDLKHALTRERPQPPPLDEVVRVVETAEDARAAVADARAAVWSAIDIESAGVIFDDSFRLLCLSVAPMRGNGDESPWGWDESGLVRPETRGPLEEYLAEEASKKRGQNVSFDVNGLKTTRFRVNGVEADIRLWRKLLDVEAPADLESIMELVGMGGGKEEQQKAEKPAVDRIKFGVHTERRLAKAEREGKRTGKLSPKAKESLDALADLEARLPHIAALARNPDIEPGAWAKAVVPVDLLLRYNGRDGVSTARAGVKLERDVKAVPPVNRVRTMVVDRAQHAAQRVEEWGVPVDMDALRAFDSYCMLKISGAKTALSRMVGPDFNPGSHPQVRELLFNKLRLKSWKKTKGGVESTDDEALADLKGKHPIVDQILVFREFDKMQSNYAGGMIPWVRADGRVHPSVLLDGAKSGRASIKKPAMQTLPSPKRDPEMGVMARDVFAATPGRTLIQLDFKQVEWRVAAMLSKDPIMTADIVAGRDPHWETARAISRVAWGIAPEAVTEQHRALVKPVNFGVLYGKGVATLAKDLGCSKEQAEAILNAILGRYSTLARWIKNNLRAAQKTGYVHTWWAGQQARRRPMFDLDSKEDGRRKHAENGTCLDAETEALTKRGWVRGFDLQPDDVILTKNKDTGTLEWGPIVDLMLWPHYDGPLVEFKSKTFHAVSTPRHRWLVNTKTERAVERMTATLSPWGDHKIHRTGDYRPMIASALTPDEAELLGWFVTDGSLRMPKMSRGRGRKDGRRGPRAFIHQSSTGNPDKCGRIDALINRLDLAGEHRRSRRGDGARVWSVGARLSKLLHDRAPERTLTTAALLDLDREALDRLREAMLLGDGTRGTKDALYTGRKAQAEAFQILCTLTGSAASIRWSSTKTAPKVSAKMKNSPKSKGCWVVTILRRDTVQVLHEHRREIHGKYPIWCPVVPNTFFVARRSGTVFVTGNTNNPIQGTANEFQVASLVQCVEWIEAEGLDEDVKLVLPVHDSLLFDVADYMVPEVVATARAIMTGHDSEGVPLDVDVECGRSWGSLTKYVEKKAT